MEDQPQLQPLGEGLFYQGKHPVSWCLVEPDAKLSDAICRDNERLLRLLNTPIPSPSELLEEQSMLYFELLRLELKLDLLFEQIGLLLAQQVPLPESVPLQLTAQDLQWWTQNPPAIEGTVQVKLYLREDLRRPIILLGKVKKCETEADGHRVWVRFVASGEGVREGLERFIFRWHRRHIAQTRRNSESTGLKSSLDD